MGHTRDAVAAPAAADPQADTDWVALSGVSPTAHSLHRKILMGNVAGAPVTADTLACLLGLSRPDKIGPYLKELQAIGAADVSREGIPCRNVYTARATAPARYEGPTTFSEWLAGQQGEIVYYVRRASDRAIKIGWTADRVSIRMARFRRDYGPVELLGYEQGGEHLEQERHRQFASHQMVADGWRTEWFRPGRDLQCFVDSLGGAR